MHQLGYLILESAVEVLVATTTIIVLVVVTVPHNIFLVCYHIFVVIAANTICIHEKYMLGMPNRVKWMKKRGERRRASSQA